METKTWSAPRNLFLHLLMIGALYAAVVSVLVLLFQYINVAFPDVLSAPYAAILERIRRAESSLLVVFPVFLFASRILERDIAADPARRDAKIRKWLLYGTLFLSAVTIIVDLIILIYNFLGGELYLQFFLKIGAVFAVAAAVFGYYFWEVRRRAGGTTTVPRMAAAVSAAAVLAAVVAGFFIVGSPAAQRARRFDEERVSHLSMIQRAVINYWTYKGDLPPTLDALKSDISGFIPPADPESRAPYEYRITSPLSFDLCAVFKTDGVPQDLRYFEAKPVPLGYPDAPSRVFATAGNDVWNHPAGRSCFSRIIDPAFYSKEKPEKPVPRS